MGRLTPILNGKELEQIPMDLDPATQADKFLRMKYLQHLCWFPNMENLMEVSMVADLAAIFQHALRLSKII